MIRGATYAVLIAAFSHPISAEIISTFDGGLDGWIINPEDEPSSISHVNSGGNPGGYLQLDDRIGENWFQFIIAPANFLGDLRSFDGGTLGFDARLLVGAGPLETDEFFGIVRIRGESATAQKNVSQGLLPGQWTKYSTTLTADAWGLEQAAWLSILSTVQAVEISAEPVLDPSEVLGFDNIFVSKLDQEPSAITLPPAILLLASSLALFSWRWRRRT